MASFTLIGTKSMAAKMEALAKNFPLEMERALRGEAEEIMTKSKSMFVPANWGTLRASGRVKPVTRKGRDLEVEMEYGDAASPYALAIHEHPSSASPPSWQGKPIEEIRSVRTGTPWVGVGIGKGPKYLERPMMAAIPGMPARIAKKMRV